MSLSGRQAAVMGLAEQKSAEKVAYLTTARDDGEPRNPNLSCCFVSLGVAKLMLTDIGKGPILAQSFVFKAFKITYSSFFQIFFNILSAHMI